MTTGRINQVDASLRCTARAIHDTRSCAHAASHHEAFGTLAHVHNTKVTTSTPVKQHVDYARCCPTLLDLRLVSEFIPFGPPVLHCIQGIQTCVRTNPFRNEEVHSDQQPYFLRALLTSATRSVLVVTRQCSLSNAQPCWAI